MYNKPYLEDDMQMMREYSDKTVMYLTLMDIDNIELVADVSVTIEYEYADGYWFLTAGLRMPVGFSFIVKKNWEIFIEIAPTVNVVAVGNSGFYVFGAHIGKGGGFWLPGLLGFGGEFGFRYWF